MQIKDNNSIFELSWNDTARFRRIVIDVLSEACRVTDQEEYEGIGTLGEKQMHAAIKRFICPDESCHEIKIDGSSLCIKTDESEENIDSLETDESDETNEAVKSTQIEVWICAGIDQPNRPLADDEIPPENHILHGVIEFDSQNDSTEDSIESQADTQT